MKDRLAIPAIILVLLAAVGLIIYVHISTVHVWMIEQQLRQEGVETAVTVLSLAATNSVRGPSYCQVTFAYSVNDTKYTQTTKVSSDFCNIFREGSQVEARYLADDPETADLIWGGYKETQLLIMLFCDGTTLLLAVFAIIAHRLNRQTNQQNRSQMSQQSGFPFIFTPPRGAQLMEVGCLFPFGLLVTGMMGVAMGAAIFNWREMDPGLPIVLFLSATPFFAFGLLIIYLSLKDFIHSFTFTADQIHIRHILLRRKSYPVTQLQNIVIEARPLRNYRKTYALVLRFQDSTQLDVQQATFADGDQEPPEMLYQLQTHLKQLYDLA